MYIYILPFASCRTSDGLFYFYIHFVFDHFSGRFLSFSINTVMSNANLRLGLRYFRHLSESYFGPGALLRRCKLAFLCQDLINLLS